MGRGAPGGARRLYISPPGFGFSPRPFVEEACGSMSIKSVDRSAIASAAARLTAVVVFPTPPFWLAMATMRPMCGEG